MGLATERLICTPPSPPPQCLASGMMDHSRSLKIFGSRSKAVLRSWTKEKKKKYKKIPEICVVELAVKLGPLPTFLRSWLLNSTGSGVQLQEPMVRGKGLSMACKTTPMFQGQIQKNNLI